MKQKHLDTTLNGFLINQSKTIDGDSIFDTNEDNDINIYENLKTIEDTTIGKTIFKYEDVTYRLTGYVYVYYFTDGEVIYANTSQSEANAITGYSVSGCIALLKDVIFLDRETNLHSEHIESFIENNKSQIEEDKDKYLLLKKLPPNLSYNEYTDLIIDDIL